MVLSSLLPGVQAQLRHEHINAFTRIPLQILKSRMEGCRLVFAAFIRFHQHFLSSKSGILQALLLRISATLPRMDYLTLRLDAVIRDVMSSSYLTLLAIESSCICNCKRMFSVSKLLVLCAVLDIPPDSPISRQNVPGIIKSRRQSLPVCNIILVQLWEILVILNWISDSPPLSTSTCLLAPSIATFERCAGVRTESRRCSLSTAVPQGYPGFEKKYHHF